MSGGYIGPGPHHHSSDPFGLDNSQSYLGMEGAGLADTAIAAGHHGPGVYGDMEGDAARARLLASHRFVCVMTGVNNYPWSNVVM